MAQIVLSWLKGILMHGRKILAGFSIVSLVLGLSCALNPQPEPPQGDSVNDNNPNNPTTGGVGVPAISEDSGLSGPGANDNAEAGAERQDSSSNSDGSMDDGGPVDAASDAGDAGAESSIDARADAPEEGATTTD